MKAVLKLSVADCVTFWIAFAHLIMFHALSTIKQMESGFLTEREGSKMQAAETNVVAELREPERMRCCQLFGELILYTYPYKYRL